MNVYLAADFAGLAEAQAMADKIQTWPGVTVVSRWHTNATKAEQLSASKMGGPDESAARAAALRNLQDLDRANVLVVLTTGQPARGGRHFETGYAHGTGKAIVLLGQVEHAFHRLPGVTVTTIEQLQGVLRSLEEVGSTPRDDSRKP